jgi:hypothetical protein
MSPGVVGTIRCTAGAGARQAIPLPSLRTLARPLQTPTQGREHVFGVSRRSFVVKAAAGNGVAGGGNGLKIDLTGEDSVIVWRQRFEILSSFPSKRVSVDFFSMYNQCLTFRGWDSQERRLSLQVLQTIR